MKVAKISEIFMSLQGEGLYVGVPQIFVRFYGCNISCSFCDTKQSSYKTLTRDALLSKLLEYKDPHHSVSLTGGEPLLQADFIQEFLREYDKFYKKRMYLETNGILYKELSKVIDYVDIIAMDFKLPSSTGLKGFWKEHENFLKIAKQKEIFVKAVITDSTTIEDITRMSDIIKHVSYEIPVVLQPVSPLNGIKEASIKDIMHFKNVVGGSTNRVDIIKQTHKIIGIK